MNKTVIVTGGAGFIGSHTCKRLALRGYHPVVVDNLITGHKNNVRWGPLVEGDIGNKSLISKTLDVYKPLAVIHFAGSAYVGESVSKPEKYYLNNVVGSLQLLECCVNAGVKNFIFSSSCATYGIPEKLPIDENCPQFPTNPYGRTKLIIEHALEDFSRVHDLHFVTLRYFNAAGADLDSELVEQHDPETHLIPRALLAAAGHIPVLKVFGSDYNTKDGTCIRDYIHVCDLANGHISALEYLTSGGKNLAVNLGSGRGISVKQILQAVETITGCKVPVSIAKRRYGDPPELYANTKLANSLLGFKTKYSNIESIIGTAAPNFGFGVR